MSALHDLVASFPVPPPPRLDEVHDALREAFGGRQRQFDAVWYSSFSLERPLIAKAMGIEQGTVETHLKNAYRDMRLTRHQATRLILGLHGLWPPQQQLVLPVQ